MERDIQDKEINIEISDERDCRKVISVQISPDRFESEKEQALKEFVKKVSLPGFRKGKVPEDVVRQQFGADIKNEALKNVLPLAYGHIVATEKLQPLGEPIFSDIKAEENEPLSFRVDVEVAPSFEIGDYHRVKVKAEKVKVSDEEIEDVLKNLQERGAEYVTVDRPAVNSDMVIMDFAPLGKDDEVIEKQHVVTDYPAQLGTGQLFPAFENAVTGRPAGSTGKVEIDYPEDYKPERLAGKKVTYEFTIKEVKEKRIPPLDDEFARKIDAKMDSMSALRDDVKKRLTEEKAKEAQRKGEEKAIDLLLERNPFDVPRSMIERYKKELYREDEKRRQALQVGPEEDEEKKKQIDDLFARFIHIQDGADSQSRQPPGMNIDLSILHPGHRAGPLQEIQKTEHSMEGPRYIVVDGPQYGLVVGMKARCN